LCERLAQALRLRAALPGNERGQSPDAELLDTNAYRKLIQEKVTTAEELARLGKAIEEKLGMNRAMENEPKMADIAREAGIDLHSAIFYRDLALAAAEIRIEQHVNEVLKA
jgi:hypothetical protein